MEYILLVLLLIASSFAQGVSVYGDTLELKASHYANSKGLKFSDIHKEPFVPCVKQEKCWSFKFPEIPKDNYYTIGTLIQRDDGYYDQSLYIPHKGKDAHIITIPALPKEAISGPEWNLYRDAFFGGIDKYYELCHQKIEISDSLNDLLKTFFEKQYMYIYDENSNHKGVYSYSVSSISKDSVQFFSINVSLDDLKKFKLLTKDYVSLILMIQNYIDRIPSKCNHKNVTSRLNPRSLTIGEIW